MKAAFLALFLLTFGFAAEAEPIDLTFRPVQLNDEAPQQDRLGGLVFRGGLALSSRNGDFGGWSDLRFEEGSDRLMLLSDRGHWLRLNLSYDGGGKLAGIDKAETGALIGKDGTPVGRPFNDSEGLIPASDGGWVVSFENRHRLWHYPQGEPPFSKAPVDLPMPPGLNYAPTNEGIEAIAVLPDGRLFAIAEGLRETGGANIAWIGGLNGFSPLAYVAAPGFGPTAATFLPDGDVVVLERRFSLLGGFNVRMVRVPGKSLASGARIEGKEIARFEAPALIDNFEGIEAKRGPSGETLLYLVSDDNFSAFQRTLILVFAVSD